MTTTLSDLIAGQREPEPETSAESVRGGLESMLHGATFGFSPHILARLQTLTHPGSSYDDWLAHENEMRNRYMSRHPVQSTVQDLGGSLMTGAPISRGLAMAAPAATNLATKVAKNIMAGPGGQGAIMGGVTSFNDSRANDLEGKLKEAGTGGVLGGVFGGTLGLLAKGFKGLMGATGVDWFTNKVAASGLFKAMKSDGLDPLSEFQKVENIQRATGKPYTLADHLADPDATPNTTKYLRDVATNTKPEERNKIFSGVDERLAGQQDRVLGDFSQKANASEVGGKARVYDELKEARREATDPLFAIAKQDRTPKVDLRLNELYSRPSMISALETAKKASAEQGKPLDTSFTLNKADVPPALVKNVNPANGVTEFYTPNMELLHRMKVRLAEAEKAAMSTPSYMGARPEPTAASKDILKTRQEFTSLLKELGPPEYAAGLKIHGEYEDIRTAYRTGTDLFKSKTDAGKIRSFLSDPDTSIAEADAFSTGVRQAMSDLRANESKDWTGKILKDSAMKDKLRAAFGPDQKAADMFLNDLHTEHQMALTGSTLRPGVAQQGLNVTDITSLGARPFGGGAESTGLPISFGQRARFGLLSPFQMSKPVATKVAKNTFGKDLSPEFRAELETLAGPPQGGHLTPALGGNLVPSVLQHEEQPAYNAETP